MLRQTFVKIIAPAVTAMGYDLWGVEYIPQGKYSVLRVYIEKPNGVTIDDCQQVARQLSAVLDVEDVVKGKYNLEVSSPGIERLLFTAEQFAHYNGRTVKIKLHHPIEESRRNIVGNIKQVEDNSVRIVSDEREYVVSFDNIVKAKLTAQT